MRLFFDILGPLSKTYDYSGQYFEKPEDAAEMARLIALDLGASETAERDGMVVEVRCAAGQKFFSVPIEMAA